MTDSSVQDVLDLVRQEHEAEVQHGFSVFGRSTEKAVASIGEWSDKDFTSRQVEAGKAGPEEFFLTQGNHIFQSKGPVVSDSECADLIQEAKQVIDQGLSETKETLDGSRTNSQLGEARLSQLPIALTWLKSALHERFFPILESRFGVPANELTLHDALIIGYGYLGGDGARSQPIHRDASLLSLNVALSPRHNYDKEGGGTFFEGLSVDSVIHTEQGHLTCHAGGLPHAGRGIDSGERWILVLFCLAKSYPELARRCHARGILERGEHHNERARKTFEAGLSVAPSDHLLLTSLGGVHMELGDKIKAQASLHTAAIAYPDCCKANLGMGKTMLGHGRPRAALRRFDAVLDYLQDRDLKNDAWIPHRAAGWDARVNGARAALLCSRYALQHGKTSFDSQFHLHRAVQRLNIATLAVPEDENLQNMLHMAKALLEKTDRS